MSNNADKMAKAISASPPPGEIDVVFFYMYELYNKYEQVVVHFIHVTPNC